MGDNTDDGAVMLRSIRFQFRLQPDSLVCSYIFDHVTCKISDMPPNLPERNYCVNCGVSDCIKGSENTDESDTGFRVLQCPNAG
jgi:hypothetical protein